MGVGVFFLLFSATAIFGALMLVLMRNPIVSALYLVLSFGALAGLFVLLSAPFLAAVQVVVYAGAIMVLFLFVIMLLNIRHDVDDGIHHAARRIFGWMLGVTMAALVFVLLRRPWALGPEGRETPEAVAEIGNTQAVGIALFSNYLLAFEIVGLILLVAMVGAVVLSLRRGTSGEIEEAP